MKFSAFARFGHFRFSSQPTIAETIYKRMVAAMGGDEMVADNGVGISETLHAELYATAMALATAKRNFDRVAGNANPQTAVELLSYHERMYGFTPTAGASDDSRRAALAVAEQVFEGCRRDVVHTTLRSVLGDDLVDVRYIGEDDYQVSPTNWSTPSTRPGTWKSPSTILKRRAIATSVHTLGSQSVDTTHLGGSSDMLVVGDSVVVEPGRKGLQEACLITEVNGTVITTTFTKPHPAGVELTTEPWPTAVSSSNNLLVVVTEDAATSTATRKRIAAKLNKLLTAVDTFDIVSENELGCGVVGPLSVGLGLIGVTTIGGIVIPEGATLPTLSIEDGDMSAPDTSAWTGTSLSKAGGKLHVPTTATTPPNSGSQIVSGLSPGEPIRLQGTASCTLTSTARVWVGDQMESTHYHWIEQGIGDHPIDITVVPVGSASIHLGATGAGTWVEYDNITVSRP
jgi:hypothetical protein